MVCFQAAAGNNAAKLIARGKHYVLFDQPVDKGRKLKDAQKGLRRREGWGYSEAGGLRGGCVTAVVCAADAANRGRKNTSTSCTLSEPDPSNHDPIVRARP
eukprot:849751-Prymnesium_polylepis.2